MDIFAILNDLIIGWGAPWSWFLAVLAAVRLSPFRHVATSPGSRARWRAWIDDDGLEAGHRRLLGHVLDWIDAKLSPDEIAKHPRR